MRSSAALWPYTRPMHWYFTSESVTEGHPDKVADRISDSVVDLVLGLDPEGRVACETLVTPEKVIVAGEIGSEADIDDASIEQVARDAIAAAGYDDTSASFSEKVPIEVLVGPQSSDIADGVGVSWEWRHGSRDPFDKVGAGDQGIMFGYASNETDELMPAPILYAHRLARRLADVRKTGTLPYLRPDGKTQVTMEYHNGRPIGVKRLLISAHHAPDISPKEMEQDLWDYVVEPVVKPQLRAGDVEFLVNPSGRFVSGGPEADTGLTGRKIIVDTYGGAAHHGGGCFSGKDATKVDRSGAYAARHAAKSIVAAGLADRCELQISYAIGRARPFSIRIEAFGTEHVPLDELEEAVLSHDFRPEAIMERFDLRRPIYTPTSAYGHFGRPEFPWEIVDGGSAV